ncbi:MAG TPA: hypothetical protein VFU81_23490, partial [Thermomicrobiales bacterium]|nr:hypothetical protein [Thermomicrobiales bacterium]
CKNDPNGPPGAPGTCTPASVGCSPLGPTPTPTAEPACTDVGCPCTAGVENSCAPGLVCCQSQMTAPNYPGGPGMCATQDGCGGGEPPVCRTVGCRCNGGVQGACEADLICCPDDPGLPGGPGRCSASDQCNQNGCTSAGCGCLSGVQGACDDGLVCCADDPSLPGGPGRCQDEATCFANQCQATTNPCPSACGWGGYCAGCCAGYCGADGHCGAPPCTGVGCECMAGVEGACDAGLVCCQSQMNGGGMPGGPGQCAAPDACGGTGAAPAADTTTTAQPADVDSGGASDTTGSGDGSQQPADNNASQQPAGDDGSATQAPADTTAPGTDDTLTAPLGAADTSQSDAGDEASPTP